ncbi:ataxin-7-like protein 2b [Spinachia spinachia]
MAALDRRNPNLDDFVGLNWSSWVERVNILPSDAGSNVEDCSKQVRNPPETMTLKKEDMHTFGHCPAHDEIYLVMCSHCGQVVKPQAFEKHCERRHGPLPKMCGQSPASASQQRLCPARPLANHTSSRDRRKDGRCHEATVPSSSSSSSSSASPVHQHRTGKAHQDALSFRPVEQFPHEKSPLPHHSSSAPYSDVPPLHAGPEVPCVQKPTASQSRESRAPLRRTRTYKRTYKNINKKRCDLNKPCGALVPERKELCSQELICNTDSIHQQQKASGTTQTFGEWTEQQKRLSADRDTGQLPVRSNGNEQQQQQPEKKTLRTSITYNSILGSAVPSESVPQAEGEGSVEGTPPFNRSMVSGEESDDGRQQEALDLPATPWHPKPLGLCTFGCRTLGCSIFTFNRRWHHLRFALGAMLERHVSTHLWKKMPQVSSGLRSCHVTHPTVGSPVRTIIPTKSTVSLSVKSTSLVPLETKASEHVSQITKSPSSTTSARFMQDASAAPKVHIGDKKSSKYIRDPMLNEKGQPHVPSVQGTVNGTFSHNKKPGLPLHAARSRGRPLGIQQKAVGYDQRGPAQKHKDCNESQPLGSSLAKCQRLSSPPQRGEKMERISGTRMLWAWRKDPTPEK